MSISLDLITLAQNKLKKKSKCTIIFYFEIFSAKYIGFNTSESNGR